MAEIGIWFSCAAMMGLFLWAIHEGINFFVVLIIFLTCISIATTGSNLVTQRYRGLLPKDVERN